jgi:hypothetical protein
VPTLERKVTLWGGPEDGLEVTVEDGAVAYFVTGPIENWDPTSIIADPHRPGVVGPLGKYAFNRTTKRFEWRGYE